MNASTKERLQSPWTLVVIIVVLAFLMQTVNALIQTA
jgi:hypothetical protein